MEEGREAHKRETRLERRRTLRRYGLEGATRRFGVRLFSERLLLSGEADLVLDHEASSFPVEFKDASPGSFPAHRFQVACYGVLLRESERRGVEGGFVWNSRVRRLYPVSIGATSDRDVLHALDDVHGMLQTERMPAPTRHRGRCVDCEFRNYCGDV